MVTEPLKTLFLKTFYRIEIRHWGYLMWHLEREADTEAEARMAMEELKNQRMEDIRRSDGARVEISSFGGVRILRIEVIESLNLDNAPESDREEK